LLFTVDTNRAAGGDHRAREHFGQVDFPHRYRPLSPALRPEPAQG
jgi:hypothetical protein